MSKKRKITWRASARSPHIENLTAATPPPRVRICSRFKAITATALARVVDHAKIALDTQISLYLRICALTHYTGKGMKPLLGMLLCVTSAAGNSMPVGSGKFSLTGATGNTEKEIVVHYHVPTSINRDSRVLIVVPGAGRNGDSYRDSWIKTSEKYDVVILSPSYSEEKYPGFWNYNIGGMLSDVKASKAKGVESYKIVRDPKEWIYNDFDKLFEFAKAHLKLTAGKYDMFGHSAGGQVLHRLALFDDENKANIIIAANSGWYTVPDDGQVFPYGVGGIDLSKDFYRSGLSKKLVVFLGEKDDENETRGDLTRTIEIDRQGTHRLARGKNFFENAQRFAKDLGAELNWSIEIITGVGHDKDLMGEAAARYLYDRN